MLPAESTQTTDLFAAAPGLPGTTGLGPGAALLRGFALERAKPLLAAIGNILDSAPLRHQVTPGGLRMSVAMSNCGAAGWVSDRSGYRYSTHDPVSGRAWPALPPVFLQLAGEAATQAGFERLVPDACLVNCYEPGARMSLHQDKDELDLSAPIVSVSLGLPAVFLFGGLRRSDRSQGVLLQHGDVVVFGGPARLRYHGVRPLQDGCHPDVGRRRFNLTFRKAR
jgi:DNA oxidative demethylase